jgi:hypothetical protein
MINFLCSSVLIGKNEVIKISDFGTSRQWSEHSTKMSFAGNRNNLKLNNTLFRSYCFFFSFPDLINAFSP